MNTTTHSIAFKLLAGASALAALTACNYDGRAFTPQPTDAAPGITELGELEIIGLDSWEQAPQRRDLATYEILGPSDPGEFGGATATFMGTGGEVCVLVDPEAVFWNQSVAFNIIPRPSVGRMLISKWPNVRAGLRSAEKRRSIGACFDSKMRLVT